jgi:hypothetical protein
LVLPLPRHPHRQSKSDRNATLTHDAIVLIAASRAAAIDMDANNAVAIEIAIARGLRRRTSRQTIIVAMHTAASANLARPLRGATRIVSRAIPNGSKSPQRLLR